jgi:cellulose synthase/poly-beta-1,6-N-acetylglucosamine synthase-like glycosyltransferase
VATPLEWTFWAALALGLYPYAGYPALAWIAGKLFRRDVAHRDDYLPSVTVVTAARNEAAVIEATVLNKLDQDYPADRLEVIVVSDASDDGTDELVRQLAETTSGRVRLLRQELREGKTAALNRAVPEARGEIVVFADANSAYEPHTIRRLVRNLADPDVGYVTGRMVYVNRDGSLVGDGCTAYMRFENWQRVQETRIGSIVGVDGGVDAVRRRHYRPMRSDQQPDFVLSLAVAEQGARVVYEPEALLTEESLPTGPEEFRMRVRVAVRALWALWDKRALLNPLQHGVFAFQLASHKLLRYLSFVPLGVALVANLLLLSRGGVYPVAAACQLAVLAFAWVGWRGGSTNGVVMASNPGGKVLKLSLYFVLVNLASAVATLRFLRGERVATWNPRVG